MKHRLPALLLALFLLCLPFAAAAEDEPFPDALPIEETVLSPEDEAPPAGPGREEPSTEPESEEPSPEPETEGPSTEEEEGEPVPVSAGDPSEFGIYQNGDGCGPQTIPGEAGLMSGVETELYNRILAGILAHQEKIDIRNIDNGSHLRDSKMIGYVFCNVINDHPELFYAYWYNMTGWNRGDYWDYAEVVPVYHLLPDMAKAQRDFDAAVARAMQSVEPNMSPLEKALALHDYIILNAGYNWDVANNISKDDKMSWTAYGALVQGNPVCEGYTMAYALLLKKCGIDCLSVATNGHIWNMVRLDPGSENWYHVDLTWDDAGPDCDGFVYYRYFLLDDYGFNEGDKTHVKADWYHGLPDCTDTSYRSGWIFNGLGCSIYRHNGQYYYINNMKNEDGSTPHSCGIGHYYDLYRTGSLQEEGTPVRTSPRLTRWFSTSYGLLWHGDSLYYVPYMGKTDNPEEDPSERSLMVCDLNTGKTTQAGRFHFTQTAVPEYKASSDQIGLRYNAAANTVEVTSSTRRMVVASFPVHTYPAHWGELPIKSNSVSIAGLTDDRRAAVLRWGMGENRGKGLTLWAAYYRNGEMVDVKSSPVDLTVYAAAPDLKLVELPGTDDLPYHDTVQLILLKDNYLPACPSWKSAA